MKLSTLVYLSLALTRRSARENNARHPTRKNHLDHRRDSYNCNNGDCCENPSERCHDHDDCCKGNECHLLPSSDRPKKAFSRKDCDCADCDCADCDCADCDCADCDCADCDCADCGDCDCVDCKPKAHKKGCKDKNCRGCKKN